MKKFKIIVDGKAYEVEVEEIGTNSPAVTTISSAQTSAAKSIEKPTPAKAEEKETVVKSVKVSNSPTPKASSTAVSGEEVKAPMPGKVLQLKVKEGDNVKDGDTLLILEAMKMENEIIANASGSIKKINVTANNMVDTGDLLMVIG